LYLGLNGASRVIIKQQLVRHLEGHAGSAQDVTEVHNNESSVSVTTANDGVTLQAGKVGHILLKTLLRLGENVFPNVGADTGIGVIVSV
jgi:hypothetical protein